MKTLLKLLPYLLCVGLYFVGRWTAPQPDKELIRRFEIERKYHQDQIKDLEQEIIDLSEAGITIREKMYQDSLKTANAQKANNEAYLRLKKQYEKINLSRASTVELDSIRAGIVALHPIK